MHSKLRDLNIGTLENIETADEQTSIIDALKKFVTRRVSALPLIDADGKLKDIYAKFDVIVSLKMLFLPHRPWETSTGLISRFTKLILPPFQRLFNWHTLSRKSTSL